MVPQIANQNQKNTESNAILTPLAREMNTIEKNNKKGLLIKGNKNELLKNTKKLFLLFGEDNQKNNSNGKQSSENINIDHRVVNDRHNNYDLINNKQIVQKTKESINPDKTTNQLKLPANNGPTNTEAKNICPTSAEISESLESDIPHVLELVDLSSKMYHFPSQMSGGEQQRLAIARAIINQPELIIADEPTGNLDAINTYEIVQILKKINDLGTTVILTTHNRGVIDSVGKRVITMEKGKIVRDDKDGKYVI